MKFRGVMLCVVASPLLGLALSPTLKGQGSLTSTPRGVPEGGAEDGFLGSPGGPPGDGPSGSNSGGG